MTWPPGNQILIDTNVFKHLCDKDKRFNPDGNVDKLLSWLLGIRCRLLVDDQGLFRREFEDIVGPLFKKEPELEREVYLLRYWSHIDNQDEAEITENRELINIIKGVIIEKERIDIAFVYISLSLGRVLVSNDGDHIVLGPASKKHKDGDRRSRLNKDAKKQSVKGSAILFSWEALGCLEESNA
jgi:hypothetical protein